MFILQVPVHFYQQSNLWETVGSWCLGGAVFFEGITFFFEAYEDNFERWCRWARRLGIWSLSLSTNAEIARYLRMGKLLAGGLGIIFLIFLIGADMTAGHFRQVEDKRRNDLLARQGVTITGLTDRVKDANRTVAQLQGQLGSAKTLISQLQEQIDDAKQTSGQLLALTRQESQEIIQLQQNSEVGTLALRAEDDDALAFDRLQQYAVLSTADPRQEPAESTVHNIILARNSRPWKVQTFQEDQAHKQTIDMFNSFEKWPQPELRRAICDTISQYPYTEVARKSVFQALIHIAERDPSLNVREAAYRAYGQIMFSWWRANNAETASLMTPDELKSMHMSGITVLDIKTIKEDWARKEARGFFPE